MVKSKSTTTKGSQKASQKTSTKYLNRNDGFVFTIEDDDENVPDMDSEDEKNEAKDQGAKKTGKKANGASNKKQETELEIDPEFQFSFDGFEANKEFTGWDFGAPGTSQNNGNGKGRSKDQDQDQDQDQDSEALAATAAKPANAGVDLDAIIRKKGGLENAEKEEQIVEPAEEDDSEEVPDHGDEDGQEDDAEDAKNESDDDESNPVDTAEDMAKFYAPSVDSEQTRKAVHSNFQSLSLSRPVLRAVGDLGYVKPSPVQAAVIPIALTGSDIVAGAVTGSGKTAAYLIPIIERLLYRPKKIASTRVIVITPTRELAIQVGDVGRKLSQYVSGLKCGLAVGGLNLRAQEQELKLRPDIVIATPGRLIDHIRNSASFQVDDVEILVLDEADRMLEEGFQKELHEILSLLPSSRQTMVFSATMDNSIKDLIQLSLHKPVRIMIDPPKQTAGGLVQEFVRVREKREQMKAGLLVSLLKKLDPNQRVIVFVSRKETAHKLRIILGLLGMKVGELHGSLTQDQRLSSVTDFKNLTVPVLLCTDLAARGLDIPKIEVVINYDIPKTFDIYLHRVGRTARAGRQGKSISFVGESTADRAIVKSAMKSVSKTNSASKNKVLGRNVDWDEIERLQAIIESKQQVIDEILEEEKEGKLITQAERDIRKGENLLKYADQIKARPKRTWFESEKDKVSEADLLRLKRKRARPSTEENTTRVYKKTSKDREENKKRGKRPNAATASKFKGKPKAKSNGKTSGKRH